MKFDDSESRGRCTRICTCANLPNLIKICQSRASYELWRFMCFPWIFAEVKFEGISVFGTFVFVSEPNFVSICAIAPELWLLNWIFKIAAVAILDFYGKWNLTSAEVAADPYLSPYHIWWRYLKGRPSYGDLYVFKLVVGRHLGFSQKWNLKVFLFTGRRFFSQPNIV